MELSDVILISKQSPYDGNPENLCLDNKLIKDLIKILDENDAKVIEIYSTKTISYLFPKENAEEGWECIYVKVPLDILFPKNYDQHNKSFDLFCNYKNNNVKIKLENYDNRHSQEGVIGGTSYGDYGIRCEAVMKIKDYENIKYGKECFEILKDVLNKFYNPKKEIY